MIVYAKDSLQLIDDVIISTSLVFPIFLYKPFKLFDKRFLINIKEILLK
jgi:hypothetical protein